ncbi:hypothetical protein HF1_08290 [Mycoplasma haemofelis str. Langford 1]|uniref:Lipoprotein n=2 Tax=Mycoplasma haemofelis TaxID=29501 RepID=F6FIW9_MYCHI|nr:hypothetical protein [Mycoplasma haemofelis]AEG73167.1 hypothetical protein MHF_0909 [Mycoplasma haemofelis Ohio2]CBY92837.1 hypothetical protein HF1_08290 [Mycoplasma haemofelis str. Langford 1]
MNKALLTLGSSVGAAGCAGAAGVAYWKSSSTSDPKTNFNERFKKEVVGRVLLDSSGDKHDPIWDQLVKEYKEASSGVLGFSDIDRDKIKSYCKSSSESTEEGKFQVYVEWCSRNTLRTQFNEKVENKSWIDSDVEEGWRDKASSYPDSNSGNLQIPKAGAGAGTVEKSSITWD